MVVVFIILKANTITTLEARETDGVNLVFMIPLLRDHV